MRLTRSINEITLSILSNRNTESMDGFSNWFISLQFTIQLSGLMLMNQGMGANAHWRKNSKSYEEKWWELSTMKEKQLINDWRMYPTWSLCKHLSTYKIFFSQALVSLSRSRPGHHIIHIIPPLCILRSSSCHVILNMSWSMILGSRVSYVTPHHGQPTWAWQQLDLGEKRNSVQANLKQRMYCPGTWIMEYCEIRRLSWSSAIWGH